MVKANVPNFSTHNGLLLVHLSNYFHYYTPISFCLTILHRSILLFIKTCFSYICPFPCSHKFHHNTATTIISQNIVHRGFCWEQWGSGQGRGESWAFRRGSGNWFNFHFYNPSIVFFLLQNRTLLDYATAYLRSMWSSEWQSDTQLNTASNQGGLKLFYS